MRLKKVRSEYAHWLTGNLKKAMYHLDYLRRTAVKHNSPNLNYAYMPGILHVKTVIQSETIFSQPRIYFWSLLGNLIIEKFLKFVKLFLVQVFSGGYLGAIERKRVS